METLDHTGSPWKAEILIRDFMVTLVILGWIPLIDASCSAARVQYGVMWT